MMRRENMYRVMIVDDEPLILAGIASMIDWEEQGLVIDSKAGNAQQALEQIKERKPDIVITDIRMPGMNGIEFMRKVREQGLEDIEFILLTNLEEFQLAKDAIALGAVAYLVKMELTEEKLLDSLRHAVEKCNMRNREERTEEQSPAWNAQKCVERLLMGEEYGEGEMWQKAGQYLQEPVLALINFDYGYRQYTEQFTRAEQQKILRFAEDIIGQMVRGYFDNYILAHHGLDGLLLIFSADKIRDYADKLEDMTRKLKSVVKDYFEVPVSLAVSRKKDSLSEFSAMLYEAMTAMNYYFSHADKALVFYSDELEVKTDHTSNFHIGLLRRDIYRAVRSNDSEKMNEIIGQVIRLLEEYRPPREQAVNACANLYFFISTLFEPEDTDFPYEVNILEKLGQMGTLDQIVEWIYTFRDALVHMLAARREQKTDKIAIQVREYVLEHYSDKITLGQVAEALGISSGYLSTIFRKQTGESFTNFVTEIKIEKAKELLQGHQYMMYEISDMLGFENSFYFSRVFKKITGISPKEYELQYINPKKI